MALAVVRVSSGYFAVLECISYSTQEGLRVRARVRVSSQYFPVLDCVSFSCARKRSWLSLWLGLAVDILQCWNVYRTVRKKDFVFLARVRVSSQYISSFGLCIIQLRKKEIVALATVVTGLAVLIFCSVGTVGYPSLQSTANPNHCESHDIFLAQLNDTQSKTGNY